MHTPGVASAMGQKGGRRRAIFAPENLDKFEEPKTANDMLRAIGRVVVQVHRGEIDPKVANCVFYGGAAFFKGSEMLALADIRKEIDELKKRVEGRL